MKKKKNSMKTKQVYSAAAAQPTPLASPTPKTTKPTASTPPSTPTSPIAAKPAENAPKPRKKNASRPLPRKLASCLPT